MKIVFMGTPEFAVPCLKTLIDNNYEISAVVTQPDRAKGRGKKLAPTPVKVMAQEHNIPVYQPEKVKTAEFAAILKDLEPDMIIVVAFGQILSKEILDIPPLGCINVHASLLPKYRGAAPFNWCIINGEQKTGITTMYMDIGLDTGDMILKSEVEIGENDTAENLHDRMSVLGAETLIKTVKLIQKGTAPREKQDPSIASYYPIMNKTLGKIDWSKDARTIRNLIRGTCPWPGAYTTYNGKTFKVFQCDILEEHTTNEKYGTIEQITKDSFVVCCGTGKIAVKEIQFENEKKMSVEAYLRGHNIDVNTQLV